MPSSIARLTALDHQRLLRLLRRTVTTGPSQQRWRDELVQLLTAHRLAEKDVLTPEVVEQAGPTAAAAADRLARLDTEVSRVTEDLTVSPVPSPGLVALGGRLGELIEAHAATLGDQVLAPLESAVARKEVRRLGGLYEQRRDVDLRQRSGETPPPRRLDLSRAELYELARRAGIEGRSGMSRRDLIAELQRRQPST
jgi:hypothetical protein